MRHESLIEWIHRVVATPEERLLWSTIVLSAWVLFGVAAYLIGPWLSESLSEEATEALQGSIVTGLGGFAAVLLVVIWELTGPVKEAMVDVAVGPVTVVKVMVVGLALGLAYTLTRITKRLVRGGSRHDALSRHQREVIHHVVQVLVFVPVVLFALSLWAIDPGNLLLGAGAIGIIVGLAARQTLGAVIAGFVLLFSRPFEIGDWVVIEDQEGIVTDVSVVNTQVRTFDDEMVMIPNDEITASNIVNRSRNGRLRVTVDVGVDYDVDVAHAVDVALEAMRGLEELRSYPEPEVVVKRFGDSAVVLSLRFWISDPTIAKKWNAHTAVVESVKTAFEREGIKIPFPQRELAGREEAGGFRVGAAGTQAEVGERRTTSSREDSDGAQTDGEAAGQADSEDGTTASGETDGRGEPDSQDGADTHPSTKADDDR